MDFDLKTVFCNSYKILHETSKKKNEQKLKRVLSICAN